VSYQLVHTIVKCKKSQTISEELTLSVVTSLASMNRSCPTVDPGTTV